MKTENNGQPTLRDLLNNPNGKIVRIISSTPDGVEDVDRPSAEFVGAMADADDLSSRGIAAFQAGDLRAAEGCFLSSLSIERRLGMNSRLAADYGNLGSVYVLMGDLGAAEDAIKRSLELGSKPIGQARNYYWYAKLYIKRGELTLAEAMARKSMDTAIGVDQRTVDSARELHNWILARTP